MAPFSRLHKCETRCGQMRGSRQVGVVLVLFLPQEPHGDALAVRNGKNANVMNRVLYIKGKMTGAITKDRGKSVAF